jgi:hypothetical protein
MASTITAGTLKVILTEQVILNGRDQGSKNTLSISSINEVSKRIITTNGTSATAIASFAGSPAGGFYVDSSVRYVRVTNLDDTNFAILRFTGDASTDFSVRLDPGASHILTSTSTTGFVDYADISGVTLEDLSGFTATADTAAVDLEVFVASA